jgi:hypothetical protein
MGSYIAEHPSSADGEEQHFAINRRTTLFEGNCGARVYNSTWHVERVHDQGGWVNVGR